MDRLDEFSQIVTEDICWALKMFLYQEDTNRKF